MPGRRVVITGMAAVTPLGSLLKEVWKRVCDGESGISNIELFDTSMFRTHFGGEVKNFTCEPYIDPREQKRLDRFAQFALVASAMALEDSGVDISKEDTFKCGVNIGSGVGGLGEMEDAQQRLAQGPGRLSPLMIPRMIINAGSGQIAIRYGLKGPVTAMAAACASAAISMGDAFLAIQRGDADLMITGGSEAAITRLGLGGFNAMRALSQRNECPTKASRPFDSQRDGFVLSEGAGVVIFEEYEHAVKRNARIYAEMLGYGMTCDGTHITAPDPEGTGAARAMQKALAMGELAPEQIQYVNAHGTGTPLGDKVETVALKTVYGNHAPKLMVSSTKSQLGHLLGASGGVELVLTALALYHGVLPPTINLENPDPELDLDFIPEGAREEPIIYAMSNSFGFGGHNASLVIGALDQAPRRARAA